MISITIIFLITSICLLFGMILKKQGPERMIIGLFATVFWLLSSAEVTSLDYHFIKYVENTAGVPAANMAFENSHLVFGTHHSTATSYLGLPFMGIALYCFAFTVIIIYREYIQGSVQRE